MFMEKIIDNFFCITELGQENINCCLIITHIYFNLSLNLNWNKIDKLNHFICFSKADKASRFEFRFRSKSTISCLLVRTRSAASSISFKYNKVCSFEDIAKLKSLFKQEVGFSLVR